MSAESGRPDLQAILDGIDIGLQQRHHATCPDIDRQVTTSECRRSGPIASSPAADARSSRARIAASASSAGTGGSDAPLRHGPKQGRDERVLSAQDQDRPPIPVDIRSLPTAVGTSVPSQQTGRDAPLPGGRLRSRSTWEWRIPPCCCDGTLVPSAPWGRERMSTGRHGLDPARTGRVHRGPASDHVEVERRCLPYPLTMPTPRFAPSTSARPRRGSRLSDRSSCARRW